MVEALERRHDLARGLHNSLTDMPEVVATAEARTAASSSTCATRRSEFPIGTGAKRAAASGC